MKASLEAHMLEASWAEDDMAGQCGGLGGLRGLGSRVSPFSSGVGWRWGVLASADGIK